MSNVKALVLRPEDASSQDATTFPGFPGVWRPGEPRAVSLLGLSAGQARDLVRELGLPLHETTVEAPAEDALARTAGIVSSSELETRAEPLLRREATEFPGLNEEEAAARRAAKEKRGGYYVTPPEPIRVGSGDEPVELLPAEPQEPVRVENATTEPEA